MTWDSDRDHADWLAGPHAPPNAVCWDCHAAYVKGPDDADGYCDDCRAQRDAWTDALELRMAKATGVQRNAVHPRKDVA